MSRDFIRPPFTAEECMPLRAGPNRVRDARSFPEVQILETLPSRQRLETQPQEQGSHCLGSETRSQQKRHNLQELLRRYEALGKRLKSQYKQNSQTKHFEERRMRQSCLQASAEAAESRGGSQGVNSATDDREWRVSFSRLFRYHQIHGNINIPVSPYNHSLISWVCKQRMAGSFGLLCHDRAQLLLDLGLKWQEFDYVWSDNYEKLRAACVIQNTSIVGFPKQLLNWMRVQTLVCERNMLAQDRKDRLMALCKSTHSASISTCNRSDPVDTSDSPYASSKCYSATNQKVVNDFIDLSDDEEKQNHTSADEAAAVEKHHGGTRMEASSASNGETVESGQEDFKLFGQYSPNPLCTIQSHKKEQSSPTSSNDESLFFAASENTQIKLPPMAKFANKEVPYEAESSKSPVKKRRKLDRKERIKRLFQQPHPNFFG